MAADPYFWRNISEFYSYAFEISFVLVAYISFRSQIKLWKPPNRDDGTALLAAFSSGALICHAASWVHVPIPFDLSSLFTIFLLLVLAPVLEEAIFRMALWQAFSYLWKSNWLTVFVTTVLFAAGHFAAYWFVPEQFKGFVLYQTFYVFALGAFAGWRRLRSNVVFSAVWVHFGFNLGFFVASRFFA